MKLELLMKLKLPATHSLEERETVHPHIWRVEVGVSGEAIEGRIVSLPLLRSVLEPIVGRLVDTNLNENPYLDDASRAFPTCENLALYFLKEFQGEISRSLSAESPSLRVTSIQVAVDEIGGEETGSVKLTVE